MDNASPPGNAGAVSYRGFSGGQVSQLFNGISVQYDSIAARPVDSWIYDRVEAIGGPSTFLFGAGAVGGAINYVTKLPQRDTFYEGQLRLGSFDSRQVSVGLNQQLAGEPGGSGHYLRIDANTGASSGWVDGNHSRASQIAAFDALPIPQSPKNLPRAAHNAPVRIGGEDNRDRAFGKASTRDEAYRPPGNLS